MAQIIDNHVHLIPGTPEKTYEPPIYRWRQTYSWAYGRPNKPPYERDPMDLYPRQEERVADPDGSATVAALDRAGVDAAVLIHADFGPSHGGGEGMTMNEMHQSFSNLQAKYPGRLYAFAGPDVRRPGSLELVEKAFRDWDTKGLKIFPEVGYFVNDPILHPFYQKCMEYEKPIAICTNFESPFARGRYNDPIYITDVVADFPDLEVIIFHCGNPFEHWFDVCVAMAHTALNTYLEFDAWIHPGRWPEEEMVQRLARARDAVGAHRITFGTDGQFAPTSWGERRAQDYEEHVGWWKELPKNAKKYGVQFSQEEVDLMMGLNLARLLRLVDMPEYTKKRKYGWSILMPRPNPTP
jgi:predicted TIM-barrel fold metal-dependent hydrolase